MRLKFEANSGHALLKVACQRCLLANICGVRCHCPLLLPSLFYIQILC